MTAADPQRAAEALAAARARRDDDPAPGSPEDLGHVHRPARRRAPAPPPKPDLEVLQALPAFEGVRPAPPDGFAVQLRRKSLKAVSFIRPTEAEALAAARQAVDAGELDR